MGVLACDRNGCESIMCDFYSHEHGYICWNCRDELIETWGNMTISQFMNSEKLPESSCEPLAWKRYVEELFISRY